MSPPNQPPPTGSGSTSGPALGPEDPIPIAPSPWTLNADVYLVPFWTSKDLAANLPAHTYSPLEAASAYAAHSTGRPIGGLSMIQIIRYSSSPVGPYDELLLVPGAFEWTREGADGRRKKARNPRISRIYVSQKHTCYNGRVNWNVPKHLARFDWTTAADGSVTVKVFPHDVPSPSSSASESTEAVSCSDPWFQTTFKSIPYVPSFPMATRWADLIGFGTTLVQPPLPANPNASQGELPGTDRWCSVVPQQYSRHCELGWVDMKQHPDGAPGGLENFWPGIGRWHIGVMMRNAEVIFGVPEDVWEGPKSNL